MQRWGLVLGGGGFTGTAFHAGLITALQRSRGIDARDADLIVGTSAGSTAAALLRAGFPPADYVNRVIGEGVSAAAEEVLAGMGPIPAAPRPSLPSPRPASPGLLREALAHPRRFPWATTVAAALPAGTVPIESVSPGFGPLFERWPADPMWLTAVSLTTGLRVAFGRQRQVPVADAVSASCAIPGYFAPVVIDGEPFVDGGVHSQANLDIVADAGLDTVIVSVPLATADPMASDPGNAVRALSLPQLRREARLVRSRGTRVIIVAPDRGMRRVMGLASMSLSRRPRVALAAEAFATRLLADIRF